MATEFKDNCSGPHCAVTNSSFTNSSLAKPEMSTAEVLKLTLQVLIASFGAIGNILVIIVMCKLGKKRQTVDLFVQNLAVADLGILTFTFPLAAVREKAPLKWPFGEFVCRYLCPVPEIFYGASVWFIALIAIMRYRKLITDTARSPDHNKFKRCLQEPKSLAATVWIASFIIFCAPLYFVVEYRQLPNGDKECCPDWPTWLAGFYIGGVLTFFSYVFPLLVISFTYLRISHFISSSSLYIKDLRRQQKGAVEETKATSSRLKQNKKAKKILTPLVLVFAITMLPLNVFRLAIVFWPPIRKQTYYWDLVYVIAVCAILNSSVNPVIYAVVSRDFRAKVGRLCTQISRVGHSLSFSEIVRWIRSRSSVRSRSQSHSRPVARDLEQ